LSAATGLPDGSGSLILLCSSCLTFTEQPDAKTKTKTINAFFIRQPPSEKRRKTLQISRFHRARNPPDCATRLLARRAHPKLNTSAGQE
jgi:hypothetical protein